MNVLLVEDDRDLAANVGEFLESAGHRVDYANDGLPRASCVPRTATTASSSTSDYPAPVVWMSVAGCEPWPDGARRS